MGDPRIAVVGAGSIGTLVSALLVRGGQDVTLITHHEGEAVVLSSGIRVSGEMGNFQVPLKAASSLSFHPDLVLLAVKTQSVRAACEENRASIGDAPVVTVTNGVQADDIAASVLGENAIVSSVALFNGNYNGAGHVVSGHRGGLTLGEPFRQNGERVTDIARLLGRGLPTRVTPNIVGAHWTKLLLNILANSLEAMTGMRNQRCLQEPYLRRLGLRILREAMDVTHASGIELAGLPGMRVASLTALARAPLGVGSQFLRLTFGGTSTISSTLQSLKRGRPTEVDYLNGEIVRHGREFGLPTPFNSRVVDLVHTIEQTGLFYSADQLRGVFPAV